MFSRAKNGTGKEKVCEPLANIAYRLYKSRLWLYFKLDKTFI